MGELELQLPRPTFETWLKQTEGISSNDTSFVVEVPTPFAVAWLERRMYQTIQRTVERVTQRPLEVQFQVKTTDSMSGRGTAVWDMEDQDTEAGLEPAIIPRGSAGPEMFNPRYTFSSFVVGISNRLAFSAARAVADAPGTSYNPLFIYSGVGLGKTHLLHAIGHTCASRGISVLYVTSEQFTNEFISAIRNRTTEEFRSRYRSVQVLLMDDVQFMSGKEQTHEGFFHTFNDLHNSGRQVVITSDRPPKALALMEDRLRSRFEWGLIADIQPPDLETRMAILASKAARHTIEPERIIEEVGEYYRVSTEALLGRTRTKKIAQARQVAMYLLSYELEMSPTQIGRMLGGRDHATVIHGAGKINGEINEDSQLRQDVLTIKEAIFAI